MATWTRMMCFVFGWCEADSLFSFCFGGRWDFDFLAAYSFRRISIAVIESILLMSCEWLHFFFLKRLE